MKPTLNTIAEEFLDAMNRHDADAAVAHLAEDVVFWEPTHTVPRIGREAMREELQGFFTMLPDIHFEYEAVLTDRDLLMCEWSYEATYDGKLIRLRECSVSRLDANGRVTEVRVYFDRLTLLRQLGLPPD